MKRSNKKPPVVIGNGPASDPVIMSKSVMNRLNQQIPNNSIRHAFIDALRKKNS